MAENIDELYCLSDVMPGCTIHLSKVSPAEYTKRVQDDAAFEVPYEKEEPWGVFQELEVATEGHGNGQYYVHVVQNAANEAQERRMMEAQWAAAAAAANVSGGPRDGSASKFTAGDTMLKVVRVSRGDEREREDAAARAAR